MSFVDQAMENFGNALPMGTRAEILPDQPMPDFNTAAGQAFSGRLKGEARSELMSIVCMSGLPARSDLVNAMRLITHPCVLKLREQGVVFWPAHNTSYFAFAYEKPLAPLYRRSLNETFPAMSEDSVNHYFVTPMIGALSEFLRTGITHGGIRTTNLYWRDGSSAPPQLGECLSVPAGLGQPVLFEPIERGLALPLGRGPANHIDDCYAFGVTLALLAMGHNPFQGMDDKAILQAKIERGSFNAIVGNHRLATSHIELLRGLLTDDSRQRWTATDLEMWLSGRRLTPKSSDAGRRASRHFPFAGKEYWQTRPLALALAANPVEAVKVIENGNISKWLQRSMGDEERVKDIDDALAELRESGKRLNYEDQVVTRTCIALDPVLPIFYRGMAVMPGGIATALADAMISGANVQALAEIISFQFVTLWVNLQHESKIDYVPMATQLERMRGILEKKGFGSGVERVLYELNPTLPCQSPLVRASYVTLPKQLLGALEKTATGSDKSRPPMDRHVAAFLIVRDRRSEMLFDNLANAEHAKYGVALLTLYGEMQYRYGPDEAPGLANWIFPLIEPGIKRYLSKPLQEKIRKQAIDAVNSGSLADLLKIVDDPNRIDQDARDYRAARQMYQDIQREIVTIQHRLENRGMLAREVGRPVAASLAAMLALVLIGAAIVRAMIRVFTT